MTPAGFPHSEILGSMLGWQLPEAYRSLLRPSSAPGAKASTVRSSLLTTKMLASTVQFSNNTQPTTRADTRPEKTHPHGHTLLRFDLQCLLVVTFLKKKHSRVLSGPNS